MSHSIVIASANSRLHADVILIRLRRAEIDCREISVLFPTQSMPNAVGCWLPLAPNADLKAGQETIGCAGRLRKSFAQSTASKDGLEIVDVLTEAGVDAMGANILAERLEQGHTLLCVHARSEAEVSIAWHIFRHARADTIIVDSVPSHSSSRAQRQIQAVAPWVSVAA